MSPTLPSTDTTALVSDIRRLIEDSRAQLVSTVNSALTLLYWHIGQRIQREVLQGERENIGVRLG